MLGAISLVVLAPLLEHIGHTAPELSLVLGAFLVGYLRRFGLTGVGMGSQFFKGQLFAYAGHLALADLLTIVVAGALAAIASIVPRLLEGGPAEHPQPAPSPLPARAGALRPELIMGLQAGVAALLVVVLNTVIGLGESAWAITACTYVIAGTASGTIEKGEAAGHPGTAISVPLGPWSACRSPPRCSLGRLAVGGLATMVVYAARRCRRRFDIANGAFAFALIVTLVVEW